MAAMILNGFEGEVFLGCFPIQSVFTFDFALIQ